jgi:CheY-like chemotaxis protein
VFAENGQEAVELMQRESCDLILMDIQMPVMDGYTATQTLRSSGVRIPVIAITANGSEEDKHRCREAGFTGYVTKPISIAALLHAVGEQLNVSPEPKPRTVQLKSSMPVNGENSNTRAAIQGSNETTSAARGDIKLPVDPIFRDFAVRFVRKVSDSLPQIVSSIESADGTTLSGLAHWIKGTGGTVGLPVLTEIGRELHAMAKAADYSGARRIVLELQAILAKLQRDSECELTA